MASSDVSALGEGSRARAATRSAALLVTTTLLLGCGLAAFGAVPAIAETVTIGPQLGFDSGISEGCEEEHPDCMHMNTALTSGLVAQAPAAGTITSWSVESFDGKARLVVLSGNGDGTFTITARSAEIEKACVLNGSICGPPRGQIYTFPTSLSIAAGQYIGIELLSPANCKESPDDDTCAFIGLWDGTVGSPVTGSLEEYFDPTPADGQAASPIAKYTGEGEILVSAQLSTSTSSGGPGSSGGSGSPGGSEGSAGSGSGGASSGGSGSSGQQSPGTGSTVQSPTPKGFPCSTGLISGTCTVGTVQLASGPFNPVAGYVPKGTAEYEQLLKLGVIPVSGECLEPCTITIEALLRAGKLAGASAVSAKARPLFSLGKVQLEIDKGALAGSLRLSAAGRRRLEKVKTKSFTIYLRLFAKGSNGKPIGKTRTVPLRVVQGKA